MNKTAKEVISDTGGGWIGDGAADEALENLAAAGFVIVSQALDARQELLLAELRKLVEELRGDIAALTSSIEKLPKWKP